VKRGGGINCVCVSVKEQVGKFITIFQLLKTSTLVNDSSGKFECESRIFWLSEQIIADIIWCADIIYQKKRSSDKNFLSLLKPN
jgi:hypothetical protein